MGPQDTQSTGLSCVEGAERGPFPWGNCGLEVEMGVTNNYRVSALFILCACPLKSKEPGLLLSVLYK